MRHLSDTSSRDLAASDQSRLRSKIDNSEIWHFADFAEIENVLGQDKALALLHTFQEQLAAYSDDLSNDEIDDDERHRIAHNLRSMGGQLGFDALARLGDKMQNLELRSAMRQYTRPLLVVIQESAMAAQQYSYAKSGLAVVTPRARASKQRIV